MNDIKELMAEAEAIREGASLVSHSSFADKVHVLLPSFFPLPLSFSSFFLSPELTFFQDNKYTKGDTNA